MFTKHTPLAEKIWSDLVEMSPYFDIYHLPIDKILLSLYNYQPSQNIHAYILYSVAFANHERGQLLVGMLIHWMSCCKRRGDVNSTVLIMESLRTAADWKKKLNHHPPLRNLRRKSPHVLL